MAEFWGFDPYGEKGLIFVSYNSLDWERVAPIALELRKLGVPLWYDYGLKAGTDAWGAQISTHIEKASAVIIFATKGIFERENSYVIEEYKEAVKLDIPVVPVFLDNVAEKGFFRKIDVKYRRFVNFWEELQGVGYSAGATVKSTAQTVKLRLDRSDEIKYKFLPWVDTQAEMRRKAEEAKAKAEREAQAEKARQAAEEKARAQAKPTVRVGSRVQFGSYPQSTNSPEPIMWRVLDVINGKALMISEDLLDCKQYDESYTDVTWETCTLRKWLNGGFLRTAFSVDEQKRMSAVRLTNPDNPSFGTKGGNSTEDKVFCLSIDQAKKIYFSGDDDRKAKPTAYARKNGAYVDSDWSTGRWWLRSPGLDDGSAADVNTVGGIVDYGDRVFIVGICVRPVVLASL